MAKKTSEPAPAQRPGKLDLFHKGVYPALSISAAIVFGLFGVYTALAKNAGDREIERLKAEVTQFTQREQRAKDNAQWLRVEMSKYIEREKKAREDEAKLIKKDNMEERVHFAVFLARVGTATDRIMKEEAAKFGEEVKELWEKAVKKATEEVQKEQPVDFSTP